METVELLLVSFVYAAAQVATRQTMDHPIAPARIDLCAQWQGRFHDRLRWGARPHVEAGLTVWEF